MQTFSCQTAAVEFSSITATFIAIASMVPIESTCSQPSLRASLADSPSIAMDCSSRRKFRRRQPHVTCPRLKGIFRSGTSSSGMRVARSPIPIRSGRRRMTTAIFQRSGPLGVVAFCQPFRCTISAHANLPGEKTGKACGTNRGGHNDRPWEEVEAAWRSRPRGPH